MPSSVNILPIPSLQDNYIWALVNTAEQSACIVDPGEAEPVNAFLEQQGLGLQAILITHHHWDHTNGVLPLKKQHQVPVFGPINPQLVGVTHPLRENDKVPTAICPLDLRVMTIPGHTLDHLAYYAPGLVFCGDTLFAAGCGRIFEGSALQMYRSLEKIAALADDTRVYCAHEYTLKNLLFAQTVEPGNSAILERIRRVRELREQNRPSLPSTLGEERQTNPFLRCEAPEVVAQAGKFAGRELVTAVEVFTWVRKWKDGF